VNTRFAHYIGSAKLAQGLAEDGPTLKEIVDLHFLWVEGSGTAGQQAIL